MKLLESFMSDVHLHYSARSDEENLTKLIRHMICQQLFHSSSHRWRQYDQESPVLETIDPKRSLFRYRCLYQLTPVVTSTDKISAENPEYPLLLEFQVQNLGHQLYGLPILYLVGLFFTEILQPLHYHFKIRFLWHLKDFSWQHQILHPQDM